MIIDTSFLYLQSEAASPAPLAIQNENVQHGTYHMTAQGAGGTTKVERSLRVLGLVFLFDADLLASRLFEVRLVGKELRQHKGAESGIRLSSDETGLRKRGAGSKVNGRRKIRLTQ